jgi:hypothetical protein
MKREGGINGRDDKSNGIDIRMTDASFKHAIFFLSKHKQNRKNNFICPGTNKIKNADDAL